MYKSKTLKDLSASKLELLHQRITKRDYTSGSNVNPANEFPGVQTFFKEFIMMLLGNEIFHKHLIDTLVHRIDVLNTMEWASELPEGWCTLVDFSKIKKYLYNNIFVQGKIYQQTYFFYVDTLRLLAKFLAFILYHPYRDFNVTNPASKEYLLDIRSKVCRN